MLNCFVTLFDNAGRRQGQHLYEYSDIQADQEIRVFRFSKGCTSTKINISVEHYRLDDLPQFECLSYTWGDHSITRPVCVGSRTINVTQNLWDALQRLIGKIYRQRSTRRFWADQICINQACQNEKQEQVPLMSQIFSRATRVICWLGEEDDTTQEAFNILRGWERAEKDELLRSQLNLEFGITRVAKPNALATLFSRDWFTRVWTLQEVSVSPKTPPIVLCGSAEVDWNTLIMAVYMLSTTLASMHHPRLYGDNVMNVLLMFEVYMHRDNTWIRLSTLLQRTAHRRASDPRDQVYGLLGIVGKQGYQYPKPDYDDKLTADRVFTRYTRAIIEQENNLDILSNKKHAFPKSHVPSWVFDPSNISDLGSTLVGNGQWRQKIYPKGGAAGLTKPIMTRSMLPYDGRLELHGIQVGYIERIVSLDGFLGRIKHSSVRWKNIISELNRLAHALNMAKRSVANSENNASAMLTMLAANDFWISRPAPTTGIEEIEKGKLYYTFVQWSYGRESQNSHTVAGAEREAASQYWTEDTLFELAQHNFRLDNVGDGSEFQLPATAPRSPVNGEQLLEWMDGYITKSLVNNLGAKLTEMTLALMNNGLLALVPHISQCGDRICVLLGGFFPLVLRGTGDSQGYRLLGPSYVHGVMDGQLVRKHKAAGDAPLSAYESIETQLESFVLL